MTKSGYIQLKNMKYYKSEITAISLGILVCMIVHSGVDFILHLPMIQLYFVFFVFVIEKENKREDYRINKSIFYPCIIIIIVFTVFILANFLSYISAKRYNYKSAIRMMPINSENYVKLADKNLVTELTAHGKLDNEFIPEEEGRRMLRQLYAYERS